jgi:hypothetical protein
MSLKRRLQCFQKRKNKKLYVQYGYVFNKKNLNKRNEIKSQDMAARRQI